MQVEIIRTPTAADWLNCRNAALETRRKSTGNVPGSDWKYNALMSEHSPIRTLGIEWRWIDLPYWVSVHIVRHHVGIDHFVSSQRNDLQHEYDRRKAPQDAPVNHRVVTNPQAIINISQARTCFCAAAETRQAWQMMLDALRQFEPELVSLCVPPCVYRNGICPELYSACRYNESTQFEARRAIYAARFVEAKR